MDACGEPVREDAQRSSQLRRFALDRITKPELCAEASIDIAEDELDTLQEAGYGVFAGPAVATAIIHFTPDAAHWIADEIWHPAQQKRVTADGTLELTVPYAHPRELLMDVLRYGADAEVVSPPELREQSGSDCCRTVTVSARISRHSRRTADA
jgi:predicted DNA-binding transcriptional regulator YafY